MPNKSLAFLLLTSVMCMPVAGRAQSVPATAGLEKSVEEDVASPEIKVETVQNEEIKVITPVAAQMGKAEDEIPEIKLELKEEKQDVLGGENKEVVPENVVIPTLDISEGALTDETNKDIKEQESVNFPLLRRPDIPEKMVVVSSADSISETMPDIVEGNLLDIKAENKNRLEEELKTVTVKGREVIDFSNRASLGDLELTTLPGLNETQIKGPIPMAESISSKDLPSEQLLGRITPEVFQEMADIERGNTFLKLQTEKEKLKAELEKLKASYRQQRLDEISKREDVVRTRIKWWQEQENLRLEIEKKKAEEEMLNQQIAAQEAARDLLREEAVAKRIEKDEGEEDTEIIGGIELSTPKLEELYTIESIRGLNGNLKAKLRDKTTEEVVVVQRNDVLPSGYVIKEVKKDSVVGAYGNETDQLLFRSIEE